MRGAGGGAEARTRALVPLLVLLLASGLLACAADAPAGAPHAADCLPLAVIMPAVTLAPLLSTSRVSPGDPGALVALDRPPLPPPPEPTLAIAGV